jgi:O-antigen ligase
MMPDYSVTTGLSQASLARPQPNKRRRTADPAVPLDPLWSVSVEGIWRYVRTQPPSYWFIVFYLFIEYVRPQQVWPSLDVLPWGLVAILGTLVAVLVEGRGLKLPTVASTLYIGFVAIVVASSLMALRPSASFAKLEVPLSWFLIYVLIVTVINTEQRFFVFFLSFLLHSTKMSQHGFRTWLENGFGFSSWGATGAPGWFHNSGEFGIQMCVFFPLSVAFILAFKKYWPRWKLALFVIMPVTAVASMIASSSRGALVGGAAVLVWMIARTRYRVRAFVWGAVLIASVIVLVPEEQKARFNTAGEDDTSVERLVRWQNGIIIANEFPVLGIGYNNWLWYHRDRFGGGLSHNIFIEAWSEMGYVGLFSFLSLIVATFILNGQTRRIGRQMGERGVMFYHLGHGFDGALIGYLVSGFFVTVLHYPYFWINLSMVVALRVIAGKAASRGRRSTGRRPMPVSAQAPGPVPFPPGHAARG